MTNGFALRAGRLIPGASLLAGMMIYGHVDAVWAVPPKVIFDTSYVVACTNVTPPDFTATHPGEKLIEARFRVSALLEEGSEKDVEEVLFVVESPQHRLRVADFAPRTELMTDVSGEIEVVDTTEDTKSLDTSIGGTVSLDYGNIKAQASPVAGGGTTQRNVVTEKYSRLPAKELVLSSGTTNSEHGVFFKLKPSAQTSLEGMRELTCRFAVPDGWRGDWVMLQCRAKGYSGVGVFRSLGECGYRRAYAGLHLAGDEDARFAATRLAMAQRVLVDSIASRNNALSGGRYLAMKPLMSLKSAARIKAHGSFRLPALFRFFGKENKPDQSDADVAETADPPLPSDQFERALGAMGEFSDNEHHNAVPPSTSE